MHLFCSYIASLTRQDPEDFVREVEVDVKSYDEFCVYEFTIGRFAFKQVLWTEIEDSDWTKDDVLDSDSQELIDIYDAMFGPDGDFIPELRLNEPTECIVVLDRVVLHPEIVECEQHLLNAALELFTYASLVVAWRPLLKMSDRELAQIGFKKLAGSSLVFRHSCLKNEYQSMFPRGFDDSVDATEDHEEWFLKEWGSWEAEKSDEDNAENSN